MEQTLSLAWDVLEFLSGAAEVFSSVWRLEEDEREEIVHAMKVKDMQAGKKAKPGL